mmetsp:Transcript_15496/g.33484  ORF Transcript_15496/g.33484 Transcript_15496/m.33484 type:complete len:232 (+) Transcript_15496:688-1383(+)
MPTPTPTPMLSTIATTTHMAHGTATFAPISCWRDFSLLRWGLEPTSCWPSSWYFCRIRNTCTSWTIREKTRTTRETTTCTCRTWTTTTMTATIMLLQLHFLLLLVIATTMIASTITKRIARTMSGGGPPVKRWTAAATTVAIAIAIVVIAIVHWIGLCRCPPIQFCRRRPTATATVCCYPNKLCTQWMRTATTTAPTICSTLNKAEKTLGPFPRNNGNDPGGWPSCYLSRC